LNFLNKHKVKEIRANYLVGNTASANVLLKTGFREVGKGEIFSISRNKTFSCINLSYKPKE